MSDVTTHDLNIPQVPFGDADVRDWNSEWTINTTKLGFQAEVANEFTVLSEFDWKGESARTTSSDAGLALLAGIKASITATRRISVTIYYDF